MEGKENKKTKADGEIMIDAEYAGISALASLHIKPGGEIVPCLAVDFQSSLRAPGKKFIRIDIDSFDDMPFLREFLGSSLSALEPLLEGVR